MMLNTESASKHECEQVLPDFLYSDLSRDAVQYNTLSTLAAHSVRMRIF